MSEILDDQLFLGDFAQVKVDTRFFIWKKFTHIINTASEIQYSPILTQLLTENGIETIKFPMYDTEDYNIEKVLEDVLCFMNIILSNGGKIYIHCAMGVSRSATIVIAYLIRHKNMSFDEAYNWVKERRSWIRPNNRFMADLKALKAD
jgi:protein-tyrosine phosphatase